MKKSHKLLLLGCMSVAALFFVSCNNDTEYEDTFYYRIGFATNQYTEEYGSEPYDEIKDYYVEGMKEVGVTEWDDDDPYLFSIYGYEAVCDTLVVRGAEAAEELLDGSGITIEFPTTALVIVDVLYIEEIYWKTFNQGDTL